MELLFFILTCFKFFLVVGITMCKPLLKDLS